MRIREKRNQRPQEKEKRGNLANCSYSKERNEGGWTHATSKKRAEGRANKGRGLVGSAGLHRSVQCVWEKGGKSQHSKMRVEKSDYCPRDREKMDHKGTGICHFIKKV